MKCPKCGYIGFEKSDRCRNCGYDFSLVPEPPATPDLPLRVEEPIGPLADLALDRRDESPPGQRTRQARGAEFDFDRFPPPAAASPADLPLFETASVRPDDGPLITAVPPPRPPLAVRRSTPQPARVRSRPPRSEQVDLDLKVDPAPQPAPAPVDEAADGGAVAAAFGRRIAAGLIDLAILVPINLVVIYFTLRLCRLGPQEIAVLPPVPLLIFFLILDGGYLLAFTAAAGQTIGKMALGLKVVTGSGGRVRFGRALARTLAWFVSVPPAGLGMLPAAFARDQRALHDRVAGTRVVAVPAA
jgi:uncharacterized RDD family membrane protein YckC